MPKEPTARNDARRGYPATRLFVIMASLLIGLEEFDNFREARDFSPESITDEVLTAVRALDEREEVEPFLRSILADPGETPHGPA